MINSRTNNTIRNSYIGIGAHIVCTILSFVNRTVFIKKLGVDYLGVGGLFSNILVMLSLSDLGIYTVMTYSLYKPLAEKDDDQVSALIVFFQKLYNIIGVCVFVIGFLLIPALPYLINGVSFPFHEIVRYYILILLNSVISYFVISRSTLFRADQKVYILKTIYTILFIIVHSLQIVFLFVFHNYTVYLLCQIFFTLANNIILYWIAEKKYPYLKRKTRSVIDSEIKKQIISNFKSSFSYKIGSILLNSTDNILISVLVSTAMIGYFSNYSTLFTLVNTFIMILIESVLASIGNHIATESSQKNYAIFKTLILTMYFIASFCVSCYIAGMNDFIRFWLGNEYVIGGYFIFALAAKRFVFCAIHPLWIMRESSGVFNQTRYVMLFAALINVILSVLLGKTFGISGIIIATAISYLTTVYWYEPIQLSKKIFKNSLFDYWSYIFRVLLASSIPLFISCLINRYETDFILYIILKFIICGITTLGTFYLFFHRTDEFNMLYSKFQQIVLHRRNANVSI